MKKLQKVTELLTPSGSYSRSEYVVVSWITVAVYVILGSLAKAHIIDSAVALICIVICIYVNITASIKRLRGLGRPKRDLLKIYPLFSDVESELKKQESEEEEIGQQEYNIKEYERKHRNLKNNY
jgi:uncharacterized membrane protein YhaH (DUF805 family)